MNIYCNGYFNLIISICSYVYLYDVFFGVIIDICIYKYGILGFIFVLWFLFRFLDFFFWFQQKFVVIFLKDFKKSFNIYM